MDPGHHPLPDPQLILVLLEFPVISGLVLGGLHLEPLQFIFGDCLPEAPDLFHDIKWGDVRVRRHNLGSRISDKKHVGCQRFLRLLKFIFVWQELQVALIVSHVAFQGFVSEVC